MSTKTDSTIGSTAELAGIADTPWETSATAATALHDLGVEVVVLTGDHPATAERIDSNLEK